MKYLNKMIALLVAMCMVFAVCACGGEEKKETSKEETTTQAQTEAEIETTTEETEEDGMVDYTVTIVDDKGNPIPGALVQLCMETCYPAAADDKGVASFHLAEADYKVSFLSLPKGFTYSTEEQEFYFEKGSTELTIVLKAQ